mgnify:CR=1 FL=1
MDGATALQRYERIAIVQTNISARMTSMNLCGGMYDYVVLYSSVLGVLL